MGIWKKIIGLELTEFEKTRRETHMPKRVHDAEMARLQRMFERYRMKTMMLPE